MIRTSRLLPMMLFAIAGLMATPATTFAQAMGAEDYEAPEDDAPGQAAPTPPTTPEADSAVHSNDQPPSGLDADRQLEAGDRTVTVRLTHGSDDDADLSARAVLLEAVRPPGPLQPDSHEQVVDSWESFSDEEGIARFDDLPDDLSGQRLMLRATTDFGGIAYESDFVTPRDGADIDLTVYDQTHQFPGLRISEKLVLVSPWEEYMVIDQFWTLQLQGDHAWDVATSQYERGLPLRLPYRAEGISTSGPGDFEVVDNIVYWNGVLQPDQPLTIQIRFSKQVRTSQFTFEQPMGYPVDELSVLAAIDTDFENISRLDDLTLRAPGFDVGDDPTAAGLPPHTTRDFLVATDNSVDREESYKFRLEGLPFARPVGAWLALFAGILAALFIAAWGRREYLRTTNADNDDAIEALRKRREQLLDELALIEREIDGAQHEDEILDLEEEQMLVRQRLALIISKIEQLEQGEAADAASGG